MRAEGDRNNSTQNVWRWLCSMLRQTSGRLRRRRKEAERMFLSQSSKKQFRLERSIRVAPFALEYFAECAEAALMAQPQARSRNSRFRRNTL